MIRFLSKTLTSLLSYVAACIIAGLVLWSGFLISEMLSSRSVEGFGAALGWIVNKGIFSATTIAIAAAIPAFVMIIIAEWKEIESWAYYTLGGLTLGMVMAYVLRTSELEVAAAVDPINVPVFALAGILGGLTYWYLAGARD